MPEGETFENPVDSQIYAILPDDKLFTEDEIITLCAFKKDVTSNQKTILNTISALVRKNRAKKIIGVHLEKFARKF